MTLDEIAGGGPYGATTIAGGVGSRLPTANELQGARYQGARSLLQDRFAPVRKPKCNAGKQQRYRARPSCNGSRHLKPSNYLSRRRPSLRRLERSEHNQGQFQMTRSSLPELATSGESVSCAATLRSACPAFPAMAGKCPSRMKTIGMRPCPFRATRIGMRRWPTCEGAFPTHSSRYRAMSPNEPKEQ